MDKINTNEQIETDNTKQKSSVISDLELEVIYDRVLYKIDFFRDLNCHATIWDDCIPYLERLVKHQSPELYVSQIKNELREMSGARRPTNWSFGVKRSQIISAQLYIVLYYLYRDNKTYTDIILPSLVEIFGYFKNPSYRVFEHIQKLLNNLPERKTPVYTQDVTGDSRLLQEKEDTITELKKDIAKLTDENILLREENKKLKEQDDPEEETVFIQTGQGKNIKTHKMTAKRAVEIVANSGMSSIMSKEEWKQLLSRLTGLSESSFNRYMKLMP